MARTFQTRAEICRDKLHDPELAGCFLVTADQHAHLVQQLDARAKRMEARDE
jgi:hypothetical protein